METQSIVGVEGRIWAMDEIPTPSLPLPASTAAAKTITPPLAVTQHMEPPRSFVIVNAQGGPTNYYIIIVCMSSVSVTLSGSELW